MSRSLTVYCDTSCGNEMYDLESDADVIEAAREEDWHIGVDWDGEKNQDICPDCWNQREIREGRLQETCMNCGAPMKDGAYRVPSTEVVTDDPRQRNLSGQGNSA